MLYVVLYEKNILYVVIDMGFEESVMAHDLLLILIGGALGFAVACSVIELIIRANRRYPKSL